MLNRPNKYYLIFIILFILNAGIPVESYADDALKKLGRGVANVITCPLEITKNIQETNNANGVFAAFTVGVIKGVFMTGVRATVGAYEIATFLIPIPRAYGPVLKDPEFFFEEDYY